MRWAGKGIHKVVGETSKRGKWGLGGTWFENRISMGRLWALVWIKKRQDEREFKLHKPYIFGIGKFFSRQSKLRMFFLIKSRRLLEASFQRESQIKKTSGFEMTLPIRRTEATKSTKEAFD